MPLHDTGRRSPRGRWAAALPAAGLAAALAALAVPAAASARPAAAATGPGGSVIGWGQNQFGVLGDGTTTNTSTPVFARLPSRFRYTTVRSVETSVALTTTGRVYAWGDNDFGQVGDGTTTTRLRPVVASKLTGVKVRALRESGHWTLALTSTGKVLAWGENLDGELGDGTTTSRRTPVRVKIPAGVHVTAISAGYNNGLALTGSGRVLAWGYNFYGQLGDGSTTDRHEPVFVRLPAGPKVRAMAAGNDFSAVLTRGGRILTWGRNDLGQLGDGTTTDSATPVRVHLPHGFTPTAIGSGWGSRTVLAIGHRAGS